MKYMLFIMICSFEHQACMPPLEGGTFKTKDECAKHGFAKGKKVLDNLDKKILKENKYQIVFTCGELNERV
tara:strand:+ start:302 stop:514 length:213 start_codon:yes stop_codon:yes gene_type:complete